jgi:hypothetical protein
MLSRCSEIVRVHFLFWATWGKVFVCNKNPGQGPTALMGPNNASSLLRIFLDGCANGVPSRPFFFVLCLW